MRVENKYRKTDFSAVSHMPLLFQNRNVILNNDNLTLSQLFHPNKCEFVGIIGPRGLVKPEALDRQSGAETGKRGSYGNALQSKADLRINIANGGSLAMPLLALGVNSPCL
jgi:hypothetical protein